MGLFLLSILCGLSFAAVPPAPMQNQTVNLHQMQNFQRMQAQQELMNLSAELAQKLQEKADVEAQLNQLKGPLSAAKTLKMGSKASKMAKAEAEMKSRLQQLQIDIKEIKKKQTAMMVGLAN